jgi:hypothetical protein
MPEAIASARRIAACRTLSCQSSLENALMPTRFAAAVVTAAILSFSGAAPARAAGNVEFPTLKSGLWEMTTTTTAAGNAPSKATVCLDASTQKYILEASQGRQKELCSRMDMQRDGAKYVMDAECKLGNSLVKSHGVMTMTGDTAYRSESSATIDPPFTPELKETRTVIEGKYVGACREGMRPGDMITATGEKINLKELAQRPAPGK